MQKKAWQEIARLFCVVTRPEADGQSLITEMPDALHRADH